MHITKIVKSGNRIDVLKSIDVTLSMMRLDRQYRKEAKNRSVRASRDARLVRIITK